MQRYFAFGECCEEDSPLILLYKIMLWIIKDRRCCSHYGEPLRYHLKLKQKNKSICRGIEEVITGLTRNQFVDNTTRGFESLPLRQKKSKLNPCGLIWISFFVLRNSKGNRYRADFRWTSATEEDRARSSRENRIPPSAPEEV